MNVLVTGIAGDIGSGIGRILRECNFVDSLFGCDIHDEHAGFSIFNHSSIVPRAFEMGYVEALQSLVKLYSIDAVLVTSEPELRFFSAVASDEGKYELPLVMPNKLSMEIGFDKLKTAEFIASLGCESPWTCPAEKGDPKALPCVLKSRFGAGGQSVFIVTEQRYVESYRALFSDSIWQELIPDHEEEYTCGVYGCADGKIRTIVLRRRLTSGVTGYAELVKNDDIDALCRKIGSALDLRGSINIQLRMSDRGPLVFEINPRFSSTVVFRHKLGFADVIWSIQEQIIGQALPTYSTPYAPRAKMYRTFDEIVLNDIVD